MRDGFPELDGRLCFAFFALTFDLLRLDFFDICLIIIPARAWYGFGLGLGCEVSFAFLFSMEREKSCFLPQSDFLRLRLFARPCSLLRVGCLHELYV
jgi:hypothetical protein